MNYILVDGGYFVNYRYYSLCTWWRFAKQEDETEEPFENERFRDKYRESFKTVLSQLPSKLNIQDRETITLFAKDCPKRDIWRNDLFGEYKSLRKSCDGVRQAFEMIRNDNLLDEHIVLSANRLEADDCIAIAVQEIRKRDHDAIVWVITSDLDYLQIASEKTNLIDLKFNPLKSWHNNPEKDLFCKIVAGDKSDNISSVFPRCGLKTAAKYYDNRALFEHKLDEVEGAKEKYRQNAILVDFANIPEELSLEVRSHIIDILNS